MLLEHADRLLAVATRLGQLDRARGMILELAVCGRLLDTTELLADGQQLNSAPGSDFPHHWTLATLDELGETKPRNTAPDSSICGFLPMASVPTRYGAPMSPETRPWGAIRKGYTHVADGDVVLAKITPCFENGKSGVVKALPGGFGAGTTELHVFRADSSRVLPEYVALVLKTPSFIRRGIPLMTGSAGQKRVPSSYFGSTPIPLPPLAEQRRIVARVDELMALCDQLEAQLQERDARAADLAKAALARFSEAPTVENLEYLFHPSYSVSAADLQRSILGLAVRGQLVRQTPNDQAIDDSIRTARLEAGLQPWSGYDPSPEETPFDVPRSWRWVTVDDVSIARLGKMLDKEKNRGTPRPYLRNTNVHWFRFELESIKEMPFEATELEEYRVEPGDVLICEGGHGIARSAVWEGQLPEIMFQKALHRVRPLSCLDGHFLTFCLWVYEQAGILQRYYTGAGIPHFTGKSLSRVLLPLPPLAEQRRIVAKVEELMALVDQLEAQLAASEEVGTKLLDALVAELAPSN